MKVAGVLAVLAAVVLHAGFLAFGGLLIPKAKEDHGRLQEVDLLAEDSAEKKEEKKPEPTVEKKEEEMEAQDEAPPDAAELLRSLEISPVVDAPALEAA
ncbi:MAG TPA: hypothetical protein VKF62_11040, partial [Planctomycetota bacterium]|nr:hypothetical protein [Planctomycetota bacterium]